MILVLNRKGKYSMYNFDELTSISLLISLYIAVAFYIYFQQKREWKNIVEHIRDSMPVSDNSIGVAVFVIVLILPIVMTVFHIKKFLLKIKLLNEPDTEEITDDAKYFIKKYYPEIEQDLEGISVEIIYENLDILLNSISDLLINGFGESEVLRVRNVVRKLVVSEEEEEKISFYIKHEGITSMLVIEFIKKKLNYFEITFYVKQELAKLFNEKIDNYHTKLK
ncbi:MAG: hypothetical protein KBF39_05310 [Negativicutes bacterium]|nr:hypothetical protein [Negativicutes bacterium]MBP9949494.1 hypothetical protein [Negativicutes bacterium]